MLLKIWILGLMLAGGIAAQSSQPDCQFTASFTSATPQTAFANKSTTTGGTPCVSWRLTYWTTGATGVSIQFEGTNDVAGAAGVSFTALTATQGSVNPAIGTNEGTIVVCCDYYPWLRVKPGTFTGTNQRMTLRGYGYKAPTSGPFNTTVTLAANSSVNLTQVGGNTVVTGGTVGSQGVGGLAANAAAAAGNPVQIGGVDGTGNTRALTTDISGDTLVANSCSTFAAFNLSGAGNTQIVPLSAAKKIIVCSLIFATGTPEDVKFTEGTGSNCGTGTADASGLFKNISAYAHDAMGLPYTTTAGDALCINQTGTQALGGTVWFRYQ